MRPFFIENFLSAKYKNPPHYSIKVHLKSSDEALYLADPKATRAMIALMDMQAALGGAASHFGGPSAFAELMSSLYALVFHAASKIKRPWHELFHLINDAGHAENGLYALKANYEMADLQLDTLKTFRSLGSPLTGHGESHLFRKGVYLSNGPLGSAFPQSQGLCFADFLHQKFKKTSKGKNIRLTITSISDGACMEGEARESLAAIPGFAKKGKMAPFLLILSDNNTKLTGRIDVESFSMIPSFDALEKLGWNVILLKNAHHIEECLNTLDRAMNLAQRNPKQPVLLHAKTIKGYGTKKTEASSSGGHGFPLKNPKDLKAFLEEIYHSTPIPEVFLKWMDEMVEEFEEKNKKQKEKKTTMKVNSVLKNSKYKNSFSSEFQLKDQNNHLIKKEKVQVGITEALKEKKSQGLPIISISADLPGSTGLKGFQEAYPESSLDVGVAEANMISMGAGLSKQGYIPIVDTFTQFGVTKGALPLIMASLSEAPMIAIFSHAGFQDAADGASHQSLSYYAMTSAIPHTYVYHLSSSSEAKSLLLKAIDEFSEKRKNGKIPFHYIFFLGRETFLKTYLPEKFSYDLKKAQLIYKSPDQFQEWITLTAPGALLQESLLASKILEEKKIGSFVINPSCINHPDTETFEKYLTQSEGRLVTVEEHQKIGGMSSLLTHALLLKNKNLKIHLLSLGVKDSFGQSAYKALDLYKKHNLDGKSIALQVEAFFLKKTHP